MKLIISSRYLSHRLKQMGDEVKLINRAIIDATEKSGWALILIANETKTEIQCEPQRREYQQVEQGNRKWHWVRDIVWNVEDQPIVLDITEQSINVIFQC